MVIAYCTIPHFRKNVRQCCGTAHKLDDDFFSQVDNQNILFQPQKILDFAMKDILTLKMFATVNFRYDIPDATFLPFL